MWKPGASFSLWCFISNTILLYTQVHSHTHKKLKAKIEGMNKKERKKGRKKKIKAITETWTSLLLGVFSKRLSKRLNKHLRKRRERVCLVNNGERGCSANRETSTKCLSSEHVLHPNTVRRTWTGWEAGVWLQEFIKS